MSLFLEYCVEIDNFEEKDNVTAIRKRLKAGGQNPVGHRAETTIRIFIMWLCGR